MDSPFPVDFETNANEATHYMKVLANKGRLMVMCKISYRPYTVSELVAVTGMGQPALSMHLARLRQERMVTTTRRGKAVYYTIANSHLRALVEVICYRFQCW